MYWTNIQLSWDEEHKLLMRLLSLRKAGKIGVILAECGVYYISNGPVTDIWGHKKWYSKEDLLALADSLEHKPVGRQECLDLEEGTNTKRSTKCHQE